MSREEHTATAGVGSDAGSASRVKNNITGVQKACNSCKRRYSEVMREYLKKRRQLGAAVDCHTIKPSVVLTLQADHTGPNGDSYVRWDSPDPPAMLDLCARQTPVAEDQCRVSRVEATRCSPPPSPGSSGTPEFAETLLLNDTTPPPPLRASPSSDTSPQRPNTRPSPQGHSSDKTSIGVHTFPSSRKTVYFSSDSPVLMDEDNEAGSQSGDRVYQPHPPPPPTPQSVKSGGWQTDDAAHDPDTNLNDSKDYDSDFSIPELVVGESYYPPGDSDERSYSLEPSTPLSKGSERSGVFAWCIPRRGKNLPVSRLILAEKLLLLKRLQQAGWSLFILGSLLLFIAVLLDCLDDS